MAYLPTQCEPFASENVEPGWICCDCGHFNRKRNTQCWRCMHAPCCDPDAEAKVPFKMKERRAYRAKPKVPPPKKPKSIP